MVGTAMGDAKPMPGQVHCYVDDVDAVYEKALAAGATSLRVPTDMFYGDRISMVKDKTGNVWAIDRPTRKTCLRGNGEAHGRDGPGKGVTLCPANRRPRFGFCLTPGSSTIESPRRRQRG